MSGSRCFRRITRFHRTSLPWRQRREVTSRCGCRSLREDAQRKREPGSSESPARTNVNASGRSAVIPVMADVIPDPDLPNKRFLALIEVLQ